MQSAPEPEATARERRFDRLAFAAITLGAFLFRLIYLAEIEALPLFRHLASDGARYDAWAQEIAGGAWLGEGVFYQAPLYPYFLGVLQVVLGHDLWWIRVVQISLGSLACGLLYLAGRSFFSRPIGIASGVILALYGPAIFNDALIQKTVLDLFLIGLMLALLGRALKRPSGAVWAGIGAVLGLLGLARENALVWIVVLPAWAWWHLAAETRAQRLRAVGLYAAGLALALLPVGLRNLVVGGEFALTTSQLGPNFYIGNHPGADGTYEPLRPGYGDARFERRDATLLAERDLGRSLSPREVSRYWLGQSWDYMRSEPGEWLRLLWRKWLLCWNVYEIEDADDLYLYREHSAILAVTSRVVSFGVLAPLAAVGVFLTWSDRRRLAVLYVLLASLAASVTAFYVFGRYRFSLVPLLVPFAGAALIGMADLWKRRDLRRLAIAGAVLLAAGVVSHWPVIAKGEPSAAGYNNLANAYVDAGEPDKAVDIYRRGLELNATNVTLLYNLGSLLLDLGQLDEARRRLEQALRHAPEHAEAHNNLGSLRGRQGDREGALESFLRAVELDPDLFDARLNLGLALLRRQRITEARVHFRAVLERNPASVEAITCLGQAHLAANELAEAAERFTEALRLRPNDPAARQGLARVQNLQGRDGGTRKP